MFLVGYEPVDVAQARLTEAIGELDRLTPVVVPAPSPSPGVIVRVRKILAKPIDGSDMLDEIERVLDEEEGR